MKYKLLKDFPWYRIWDYLNDYDALFKNIPVASFPDFFEPIVEKKTYDSLRSWDNVYHIDSEWEAIECRFHQTFARSETFLTREEAEDEHKRREWVYRKDKFIPKKDELYYYYSTISECVVSKQHMSFSRDILTVNLWLAFRTHKECETAIKEHDLKRLFYTIR